MSVYQDYAEIPVAIKADVVQVRRVVFRDAALVAGYLDLVPVMLPLRLARRRDRGQLAAAAAALEIGRAHV